MSSRTLLLCLVSALSGASLTIACDAEDGPLAVAPSPEEPAVAPSTTPPSPPVDPDALFREAMASEDPDRVEEVVETLRSADPRRATALQRHLGELRVVGRSVAPFQEARWLQGSVGSADTQLVVFWETWCPHCRREVPKLQALADARSGALEVVGLTRLTRGVTEEQATAFLEEQEVRYPNAVVPEATATAFDVRGVPAAALVRDGVVLWRGHPARLDEATLDGLLGG